MADASKEAMSGTKNHVKEVMSGTKNHLKETQFTKGMESSLCVKARDGDKLVS